MKKQCLFLYFGLLLCHFCISQENNTYSRKGEFYTSWGYNRADFAKSDIYFKGIGYEFTLADVVAHNRPSHYNLKEYLNLGNLTIPQYNLRLGYFVGHHWSISLGTDHMKYVMDDAQTVNITGKINATVSEPAIIVKPAFVGTFNNTPLKLDPIDFLRFEHTDGFNYAHLEADRFDKLWKAKNNVMGLDWLVGAGAGLLIPRTDAHLFGIGRNHFWNIAGYGLSAKVGFRFDVTKRLYFQSELKSGYTHLSDIRTTGRKSDFAQQDVWFLERTITAGCKFGRKSRRK
jgi:hypothetical protein